MVTLATAQLEATGSCVCSALVNVLSIEALQVAFHASIDTLQLYSFVLVLQYCNGHKNVCGMATVNMLMTW